MRVLRRVRVGADDIRDVHRVSTESVVELRLSEGEVFSAFQGVGREDRGCILGQKESPV